MRTPKYTPDEMARRADEWFATKIGPLVVGRAEQHVLAIDVDSGDFEVAETPVAAARGLRARHPEAQVFCRRVGSSVLHRMGGWRKGPHA